MVVFMAESPQVRIFRNVYSKANRILREIRKNDKLRKEVLGNFEARLINLISLSANDGLNIRIYRLKRQKHLRELFNKCHLRSEKDALWMIAQLEVMRINVSESKNSSKNTKDVGVLIFNNQENVTYYVKGSKLKNKKNMTVNKIYAVEGCIDNFEERGIYESGEEITKYNPWYCCVEFIAEEIFNNPTLPSLRSTCRGNKNEKK